MHLIMRCSDKRAINAYVHPDMRVRFEAYRREIGLTSDSALLTLLILREIRLKRLCSLTVGQQPRGVTVSAYMDAAHAGEFEAHIKELGRSASESAGALVEQELSERWLESALKGPREQGS
jgi:hypothetical protein